MDDVNDRDKLMAALAYPIGLVALIILLVEDMKNRPFQKYHAVQALAINVIIIITSLILGWTLFLACVPCLIWFATLYWAYRAYQGEYFEIPGVTNFLRGQGWL